MMEILLQYFVFFKLCLFELKIHFLSEQVIKLIFWCKISRKCTKCPYQWIIMHRAQYMNAIREIHAKADQHCQS